MLVKNFLESGDLSGRLCVEKTHFRALLNRDAAVLTYADAAVAAADIFE